MGGPNILQSPCPHTPQVQVEKTGRPNVLQSPCPQIPEAEVQVEKTGGPNVLPSPCPQIPEVQVEKTDGPNVLQSPCPQIPEVPVEKTGRSPPLLSASFPADNSKEAEDRFWSELPNDMLREIISSIDSLKDYLHCIAVCRRWRSVAQAPNSNPRCDLPFFHPLPLPMLLQPRGKNGKLHYFYSITERKVNELHVPEISNKWICGSWRGWLATVDIKDMNLIFLLNPITKVTIPLPPLPLREAINPMFKFSWYTDQKIINVTSEEVAYQSSCTTVALITCGRSLHICKIGDDKWKQINTSVSRICDVIEFKGLLYFVGNHAALFAIETNSITKVTLIAGLPNMMDASQYYLVESSGDVLLIARFLSCIGNRKTIGFTVYRLEEEPKGKIWKKIENLHDQVLFVGCNRTLCLDSNLYPECRGNRIYFADDSCLVDHATGPRLLISNAHDNGVYHMNDRKIEPLIEGINDRLPFPTIWFSPNPW